MYVLDFTISSLTMSYPSIPIFSYLSFSTLSDFSATLFWLAKTLKLRLLLNCLFLLKGVRAVLCYSFDCFDFAFCSLGS
jgi:hypothetical protein